MRVFQNLRYGTGSFHLPDPEQHVEFVKLPGKHCNGSSHMNERGTCDYNDQLLRFVRGIAG